MGQGREMGEMAVCLGPQDSLDAVCLSGLSRAQRLLGPRPPSGSSGTEGPEPKSFDFMLGLPLSTCLLSSYYM